MKRARAIDACAMLERRATALVHSALSSARGYESERRAQCEAVADSLGRMHSLSAWTAAHCGAMCLRARRAELRSNELIKFVDAQMRESAIQLLDRQRWGQVRRGLERRAARRIARESRWRE